METGHSIANENQIKQYWNIVSLSKSLSLYFMCSDQHVKYSMSRGFPLTSSLLLDDCVKIIDTHTHAMISFTVNVIL